MVAKASLLFCSLAAPAMASTMLSIVSKSNPQFCLDLLGERTQPGTPVDTWQCVAGLLGQQWIFEEGTYQIKSAVDTNKCVDAGDLKSGTELTLAACNSTRSSQYFGWDVDTNVIYSTPDKGALKPSCSMCIEIGGKELKGAPVSLSACNATSQGQQWSAHVGPPPAPKKNETFTFSPSTQSNLCLDLKDGKVDNGNPIDLVPCKAGSKGQQWAFTEGSYRIATVLNPNKCIDAADMKMGRQLMLWDCNGFPQQNWGYQQAKGKDEGTVYLTQAADSNECLATDTAKSFAVVGACIPWHLARVTSTILV